MRGGLVSDKPYRNIGHLVSVVWCLCLSPFYYGYTMTYISTIDD
jgi:hypothetical protein